MKCYDMKYGAIRGKEVIDSKGEKFGEIMDGIFDISENMIDLKYFVVGGGLVEEFLEGNAFRICFRPGRKNCSGATHPRLSSPWRFGYHEYDSCRRPDSNI